MPNVKETETDDNARAIENGKGWTANIVEMVEKLQAARDDDDSDAEDETREEIEQSVLSVQVRSGWHTPGDTEGAKPEEFEILLSTGGPALRILGQLDEHGQVYGEPELQWQDWFKPWAACETTNEEDAAIAEFCGVFYFGEG